MPLAEDVLFGFHHAARTRDPARPRCDGQDDGGRASAFHLAAGRQPCPVQAGERLDRQLFLRDGGRLLPTSEALAIDAELEPAFAALARIRERADQRHAAGGVAVAAPPTIAHRFLPGPLAAFAGCTPTFASASTSCRATCWSPRSPRAASISPSRMSTRPCGRARGALSHHGSGLPLPKGSCAGLNAGDHAGRPRRRTLHRADPAPFRAHRNRRGLRRGRHGMPAGDRDIDRGLGRGIRARGAGRDAAQPFPVAARLGADVVVRPFRPSIRFAASFLLPSSVPVTPAALGFMAHVRSEAVPFSSPVMAQPETA
jgi:hypothetical protein